MDLKPNIEAEFKNSKISLGVIYLLCYTSNVFPISIG